MNDKVVVITGASKGLGRALSQGFLDEGAFVVLNSRSIPISSEVNSLSVPADVRDEGAMRELAAKAKKRFGRIDIWINNAGVRIPRRSLEETNMKRVHEMIEVNLFGTVYGSKAALEHMKQQGSGIIVNVLSTSALEGKNGSTGYGASKGAAIAFTKALRVEVREHGVRVFGVYPGGMRTNFFDEEKPEGYDDYLDPVAVARKIISNLSSVKPEEDLFITE